MLRLLQLRFFDGFTLLLSTLTQVNTKQGEVLSDPTKVEYVLLGRWLGGYATTRNLVALLGGLDRCLCYLIEGFLHDELDDPCRLFRLKVRN